MSVSIDHDEKRDGGAKGGWVGLRCYMANL